MQVPEIAFTAVVTTFNEARRLPACLESLQFCEQLLVFDLGSTDGSVEIARQMGAEVIPHARVLEAAPVRAKSPAYAMHDWMVFLDPDEVFPAAAVPEVQRLIAANKDVAIISLPFQNYFKGSILVTTSWGGIQGAKARIINRQRAVFTPYVHHRFATPREGYTTVALPKSPQYCIKHYWMDSYAQLFGKHWRYVILEGESKYACGERFSPLKWVAAPWLTLKRELVDYRGILGGWRGIFLSFFRAGYVALSLISLLMYQINKRSHVARHYPQQ